MGLHPRCDAASVWALGDRVWWSAAGHGPPLVPPSHQIEAGVCVGARRLRHAALLVVGELAQPVQGAGAGAVRRWGCSSAAGGGTPAASCRKRRSDSRRL